ncbi:glycerol-3-phosphate acyltransferase [Aggregatilineales bacterium SYSU G02658]
MDVLLLAAAAFLLSSVPFSVVIGRVVFNVDIRQHGDGNPGATNVYRATGSRFWYIVAVMADALKGSIPVGIAYWGLSWRDERLALVAVLAIAGHAFSPFLNFKGGKAVAITGGTWAALTLWQVPIVIGVNLLLWYRLLEKSDDWVVMFMMAGVLLYLLVAYQQLPVFLLIWAGNFAILLFKHRHGLKRLPTFRGAA